MPARAVESPAGQPLVARLLVVQLLVGPRPVVLRQAEPRRVVALAIALQPRVPPPAVQLPVALQALRLRGVRPLGADFLAAPLLAVQPPAVALAIGLRLVWQPQGERPPVVSQLLPLRCAPLLGAVRLVAVFRCVWPLAARQLDERLPVGPQQLLSLLLAAQPLGARLLVELPPSGWLPVALRPLLPPCEPFPGAKPLAAQPLVVPPPAAEPAIGLPLFLLTLAARFLVERLPAALRRVAALAIGQLRRVPPPTGQLPAERLLAATQLGVLLPAGPQLPLLPPPVVPPLGAMFLGVSPPAVPQRAAELVVVQPLHVPLLAGQLPVALRLLQPPREPFPDAGFLVVQLLVEPQPVWQPQGEQPPVATQLLSLRCEPLLGAILLVAVFRRVWPLAARRPGERLPAGPQRPLLQPLRARLLAVRFLAVRFLVVLPLAWQLLAVQFLEPPPLLLPCRWAGLFQWVRVRWRERWHWPVSMVLPAGWGPGVLSRGLQLGQRWCRWL